MHEQGSQEWLDARKNKLTASTIAVLEGMYPNLSKEKFVRQKVRDICDCESEFKMVPAVQHGQDMEDYARAYYEYHTGSEVFETGLITHPKYEFIAASPDGLIGASGLLEIKCPYPQYTKKPYSIHDPKKSMYLWQVYMQMECLGEYIEWCDFLCYLSESAVSVPQVKIERVKRQRGWLEQDVDGKHLPVPAAGTVSRISLYEAWWEHIQTIANDEDLRQEYIKPASDDVKVVEATKEFSELAFCQTRLAELQTTLSEELDEIDHLKSKSNDLKKVIADNYNCSVNYGPVTVQLINRTPTIDYRKAYEYLGGDQAVLDRGESPDSFRRETNTRQINIKYGDA